MFLSHQFLPVLARPGAMHRLRTCFPGGDPIMTITHKNQTPAAAPESTGAGRGFEDSEQLRALLLRLHEKGRWAWRHDPQVRELMRHAAQRYASLARTHGLDPWEAAAAAFDAMRTGSVRRAEDPWAVITRAVQVTCIAENRANGLLCSVHQARRPKYSAHHDAERFSDRENSLEDYHPAFRAPDAFTHLEDDLNTEAVRRVRSATADTVHLFHQLGWPEQLAAACVEYICTRLADSASRASAFESLRRDYQARVMLDVPAESWLMMLRLVLGNPDPVKSHTSAARGILFRLLSEEPLLALYTDADLMTEIVLSAPAGGDDHGDQ